MRWPWTQITRQKSREERRKTSSVREIAMVPLVLAVCAVTHTKYRRAQVSEAEGGIWPRIRRQVQVCSMIHHGYMGTLGLLAGQRLRALRCVTEVTPTARPIPFTGALGAAIVEVAWPAHRASARAVRPQASANRPDRRPPWRWPPAARRAAAPTRPIANRRTTGR